MAARQSIQSPLANDPSLVAFHTVSATGIDPVVQISTLEALLTGRAYDDVVADPRSGHAIEVRDEGERVVVARLRLCPRRWPGRRIGKWTRWPAHGRKPRSSGERVIQWRLRCF